MGIKNFNKFLRDKCPIVFEQVHLSMYMYKKVAIDISLYLHKYKAISGENWLSMFINLVSSLRKNEIHCVFIFDGKAPPEKREEQLKRKIEKEKLEKQVIILEDAIDEYYKTRNVSDVLISLYKTRKSPQRLLGKSSNKIDMDWVEEKVSKKRNQIINISPDDFNTVKQLFDILKVPYYTADCEAEKLCSKLCIDGSVDAVLSEDTDIIAYKAPKFLTKIDTRACTCSLLSYNNILENLELNSTQLLDLCIMCGTDYNPNIHKVGAHTAYKHLKSFGSIEEIGKNTKLDISVLKFLRGRELFTDFSDCNTFNIPYCGKPDFNMLREFIVNNNISIDITQLEKYFQREVIIIEDSDSD